MVDEVEERAAILATVREFVDKDVIPNVRPFDHADEYPASMVATMRDMGLFGVTIPERYGGLGLGLETYAQIVAELSRGWMTLSGVLNAQFIAAHMLLTFGTYDQREHYLPTMATGQRRAAFSMTEPHAGSDVQSIRTRATVTDGGYLLNGQKMWVTNGLHASLIMTLAVTDPNAEPRHSGMTCFIVEKEPDVAQQPGLAIPPKLKKLGYRGVESTELVFDDCFVRDDQILGESSGIGAGFRQFMDGVEVGRINVAARGVGIARSAFEQAIQYAQQRTTFGSPIAEHQAIQMKLATMATKLRAAELLVADAAAVKASGRRADLEAGMAKLFASEAALEVAIDAMRIHGGYGYSQEFAIERLFRDAPLLIIGEGSNEIQQLIIARRLLEKHAI